MDNNEAVEWNLDDIINDIKWEANYTDGFENVSDETHAAAVAAAAATIAEQRTHDETHVDDVQEENDVQSIDLSFFEGNFNVNPDEVLAAEQLLNLSDLSRIQQQQNNQAVCVDVAAVVNEAAAAVIESGQTDFDPAEEQKKLLNLLQVSATSTTTTATSNESVLLNVNQNVQCQNCGDHFTTEAFQAHVCAYDEFHKLIVPNANCAPLLPEDPSASRILRENQIRIRRFLKEELKVDVPIAKRLRTDNFCVQNTSGGGGSGLCDSRLSNDFYTTAADDASEQGSTKDESKKSGFQHACSLCDRRFVHASGLLRHMEKHALDLIPIPNFKQSLYPQNSNCLRVVIKCQPCGRIFFDSQSAFKHLWTHFSEPSKDLNEMDVYCDVPYEDFVEDASLYLQEKANTFASPETEQQVENYLKIAVVGNVLQCEFCDFIFTDISYLFLHASTHTLMRRFECLSCQIALETCKDINNHFQAECVFMRENFKLSNAPGTQRYYVCNVCEEKFQTLDALLEHRYASLHFFPRLNTKFQTLQIPCEYCEFVAENADDLLKHFEMQHFKKCRLEKEMSMESGGVGGGAGAGGGQNGTARQRLYLCDVCGKSYTQSSHLWQHLRFHQGVKPFACPEAGCLRKFTIRPDLHDHIRKCHTGERPFHCEICGKRFLTGSVFYQHRLIHRGERRYECNECGKRFYRADALKNHKRIHTGEKPFDCEYCTKSFRQRGDCDKHIRARHAHLDESTREMLKLQKKNLKAAAEAAANAAAALNGNATSLQQQQQSQASIKDTNNALSSNLKKSL